MATAKMHYQASREARDTAQNREAALRVLQIRHSGPMLRVLLQEIVALGHPRAAILKNSSDSDEIICLDHLNWPSPQLAKLIEALRGPKSPLGRVLASQTAVLEATIYDLPLGIHPMIFSRSHPCLEAFCPNSDSCLALEKSAGNTGQIQRYCPSCAIGGYAAVAVVGLRPQNTEPDLAALDELIQLANGHLSHLVEGEHYYKRMCHLEAALAGKKATPPSMPEPDLLTSTQHQSLMQDKAVERRMLEIEKFASAGRLAATIAHEVNNPMEAIKNAVYLLGTSVPESSLPVYNILKSETDRVARVVRQILGLYRDTEPVKPVSVNTIIEDTLLLLNRQLQRANIRVKVELGVLPDAVIAADQIRQVLSNLLLNARDAMPDGGTLHVRSRQITGRDRVSSWVRILVADSGMGIPREIIADLFEPFVTTKGEKGTGLGLWIVKGIIQNHAGKITVRSRPGQGTVFRIDLPIAKP